MRQVSTSNPRLWHHVVTAIQKQRGIVLVTGKSLTTLVDIDPNKFIHEGANAPEFDEYLENLGFLKQIYLVSNSAAVGAAIEMLLNEGYSFDISRTANHRFRIEFAPRNASSHCSR